MTTEVEWVAESYTMMDRWNGIRESKTESDEQERKRKLENIINIFGSKINNNQKKANKKHSTTSKYMHTNRKCAENKSPEIKTSHFKIILTYDT